MLKLFILLIRMNSSLSDIQTDIQRLASQQNQIQAAQQQNLIAQQQKQIQQLQQQQQQYQSMQQQQQQQYVAPQQMYSPQLYQQPSQPSKSFFFFFLKSFGLFLFFCSVCSSPSVVSERPPHTSVTISTDQDSRTTPVLFARSEHPNDPSCGNAEEDVGSADTSSAGSCARDVPTGVEDLE
jgi:multidrug efflux pump subunit AcrA (membrane-fusion protein)